MKTSLILLTLALLAGCSTGRITSPSGIKLNAPKDASAPSSVKEIQRSVKTSIPAGTLVVRENVAATPNTPAVERETTRYSAATERLEQEIGSEIYLSAPRPPDVTVALRKADNAERRPLLYVAIACVIGAGFLLYRGKLDLAVIAATTGGALALLWWAFGDPLFMWLAFGLIAMGVGYYIYRQHQDKRDTTETLRRTVQSVEEIKAESPSNGKEIKLYQEANLDAKHKAIIEEIKPTIGTEYLLELAKKKAIKSNANTSRNGAK